METRLRAFEDRAARTLPFVLVGVVLVGSVMVDLPRRVSVAGATGLALFTILVFLLGALVCMTRFRIALREARWLWPFLLFVGWTALSLSWSDFTAPGLQNVLVFGTAGAVTVAVASSTRAVTQLPRFVGALLYAGSGIVAGLYGLSLMLDGLDTGLILSPRQFALFALVCLAWTLSAWRHGSRPAGILSGVLLLLIALSLSRTALAVGLLVLLPLAFIRHGAFSRSVRDILLAAVAGALLFALAITSIDALEERFQTGDIRPIPVGPIEVEVNVQGRAALWGLTWESFQTSPWIGHGAGSAQGLIAAEFPGVGHPLNEYLRLLHDYGIVGFAMFTLAGMALLWRAWRSWRHDPAAWESRFHLATILGMAAVAATATTDNSFIYIFTMGPLAVLLGSSAGRLPLEPQSAERDPTETGGYIHGRESQPLPAGDAPRVPGREGD